MEKINEILTAAEKLFNWVSVWCAVIGGYLLGLFGAWDALLKWLIAFMVLDYLTGILKAVYLRRVSSEIGFRGIIKKVVILVVVIVANGVHRLIGDVIPAREIVIMFFLANEGISILENATVIYPKMPEPLKTILLQIREDNNKKTK